MPVAESIEENDEYDKLDRLQVRGVGKFLQFPPRPSVTYPRTYPTIDITAADRVYRSLAVNHDSVSGNISMNHSCSTEGSLFASVLIAFETSI